MKKNMHGFTLLEVLVVTGIIGLMLAVGVNSYNAITKQSRDGRRVSDLQNVRSALEAYRSQNTYYPSTTDPLITGGFLQSWPQDPQSGAGKVYMYVPITTTPGIYADYALCAAKELGTFTPGAGDPCANNICGSPNPIQCTYKLTPLGEQ